MERVINFLCVSMLAAAVNLWYWLTDVWEQGTREQLHVRAGITVKQISY